MEKHACTMKDELTEAIKAIKTQNSKFMLASISILVLLLIGYGALGTGFLNDRQQITKINNDYAPIFLIQDMAEDNNNLINIIQMLPETTRNDPRYLQAIKGSREFQSEALRRAASMKRGSSN